MRVINEEGGCMGVGEVVLMRFGEGIMEGGTWSWKTGVEDGGDG